MEIGIIGLSQSGKSTLFEIMTGIASREIFGEPTVRGVATVPDPRFTELVSIFNPKKASPATVPFLDTNATGENAWDTIRQHLGSVDGLLHVVDAFTASDPSEVVKRYRKLEDELVISDLVIVERRLERLNNIPNTALKPEEARHVTILPRAQELLEAGKPLREMTLSNDDLHALRSFTFWTLKPQVVVVNVREDNRSFADEVAKAIGSTTPCIGICGMMEAEIAQLPPADRGAFLESLGVTEPAFERIIQTAFSLLGRMCYFTVGEDEVKAWVIPTASTAPRAAAAIHKDFERGFIKAEVTSYSDFMQFGKSIASVKSAGKLRLEGKEYIVQDGDIISFRFNV